ncbi:glycosyltransferase family 4 protein [Marinobacterium sp. xm-d-530]|uniref:glycosyltransferase family 4 protein n=1 Tax=Marinobacterium sp. xm-d-530 TaxID=2497747 RepID=UPI00156A51A1|nr:glycosyltransferase family 4 protein [Marinobacterium sp. xm-d-530]NRQ01171.1 putative glycosyl transferase [Marinobacterium sp. xm-d-530]
MKIVYLHQYFNTPSMGGSTRSYEFAKRLVAKGHEVHILTTDRDAKATVAQGWRRTDESGINVHWYPLAYSNHLSYLARMLVFVRFALASSFRSLRIGADLVFATSTPLSIAVPGLLASGFGKYRPFVFEVRDLWPEMPIAIGALRNPVMQLLAKGLEKLAYRCSESIIALSPGMRDGVIRAGTNPNKVAVIPNSCDIELFAEAESESNCVPKDWQSVPLLLYTGTLGKVNGLEYLVDVAFQLKKMESNVRILVVGDGREKLQCIDLARKSGVLNEYIRFIAPVDKYQIASLYRVCTMASNIVIDLPEARANSANKFFDSLAAKKPVLVNHGGWMHELVARSTCGLSTWRMPIDEAAELIHERMNDNEWLMKASEQAEFLAEKYFGRDILFEKLHQILTLSYEGRGYRSAQIAPYTLDSEEAFQPSTDRARSRTLWIINQYASTPLIGMGGRHYYLGQQMASQGVNVRVIASAANHLLRSPVPVVGDYKVTDEGAAKYTWLKCLKNAEARSVKRILNWFVFSWQVLKVPAVAGERPDVVLYSSPSPIGFLAARRLARRYGAKLVFEIRDIWPLTLIELGGLSVYNPLVVLMGYIERKAYRSSDSLVSNLPNAEAHIVSECEKKVEFRWIPNGISVAEFDTSNASQRLRAAIPKDKFVIGYVGTLGAANAMDVLLDAALKLRANKHLAFVLVGRGNERGALERFVADNGLESVVILDPVPKAEVPSILKLFDLCYIGWRDEPIYRFGVAANKIPEYLMSGTPVIHAYSGACDFIGQSGAGFTVPAGSADRLAEAIAAASQMARQELQEMGERGKAFALKQFNYIDLGEQMEEFLFKGIPDA